MDLEYYPLVYSAGPRGRSRLVAMTVARTATVMSDCSGVACGAPRIVPRHGLSCPVTCAPFRGLTAYHNPSAVTKAEIRYDQRCSEMHHVLRCELSSAPGCAAMRNMLEAAMDCAAMPTTRHTGSLAPVTPIHCHAHWDAMRTVPRCPMSCTTNYALHCNL
jgi:hypothetical protein